MRLEMSPGTPISEERMVEAARELFEQLPVAGRRVVVVIPDDTRTVPMGGLCRALRQELVPRASKVSLLVALGTHARMGDEQLHAHLGGEESALRGVELLQHEWDNPAALRRVGVLSRESMEELSGGLLPVEVEVLVNKAVLEADYVFVVNPVFPHEVAGFSGGHKYFFPGISGPKMVHVSHWLAALITSPKVLGQRDNPVRTMIERAADLVPTQREGLSLVMQGGDVVALFAGEVREAWSAATAVSAEVNVKWTDQTYETVYAVAPSMYRELWTAGKCMYKLEPVVEDGGELVIYAPHLNRLSFTHERWLTEIGYHTRDYFVAQWSKFRNFPWAVLADSSLTRGIGTYIDGVERPRINVSLATAIPREVCRRVNLGYKDPRSVGLQLASSVLEGGTVVVPEAGEVLWRLADGTVPDIDELYARQGRTPPLID